MYDNFEFLQSRNIDPVIPVRKGAIDILKHPRSEEARKQKDFDRWKDEKEYGMRWMLKQPILPSRGTSASSFLQGGGIAC